MGTINNVLNTGIQDIWIGRWRNSYFKGAIDDVRIWKKALTQEEISEWMNKRITSDHPGYADLKGHFSFDDGEGQVLEGESSNHAIDRNYCLISSPGINLQMLNGSMILSQVVSGLPSFSSKVILEQQLLIPLLNWNQFRDYQ